MCAKKGAHFMALKDLTGQRFGKLTVTERVPSNSRKTKWLCTCDCGGTTVAQGGNLRSGNTTSCGCIQRERAKEAKTTHGDRGTRLYRAWTHMKDRCRNQKGKDWPDYGGRGIKVCPEWEKSFEAFRDWALANGYRDDLTLDRKDTNGNYCPENCRWADAKTQGNNKRNNRVITIGNESHTVTEWAEINGVNAKSIRTRLARGWDPEEAITQPFKKAGDTKA